MPILISFARIQRSNALSFAVAGTLALALSVPEIGQNHFDDGDDLQLAQVKGKEKWKGKGAGGFTASKKGLHKDQEEGNEDQEIGKEKGKGIGGLAASKKGQHKEQEEETEDQEKGKGKGIGGLGASRKGQHREQENAASDEEDESAGRGGKRCPAGQSQAPLRGRGGSASPRGAGCL
jgi:hypothetical protein